ncbi:pectinesterase-like [Typha latifolia]|uniref:pectinesterase-like n=1 Tax=Typha latifolia TaxID=4733 RepID=UPI003C2BEEE8
MSFTISSTSQDSDQLRSLRQEAIREASAALRSAKNWTTSVGPSADGLRESRGLAWADCARLYADSEQRIGQLATGEYDSSDAATWLSGGMTAHSTCMDGLGAYDHSTFPLISPGEKLGAVLQRALALHVSPTSKEKHAVDSAGLLASWNISMRSSSADIVVAQDGTGNYGTINEAVAATRGKQQRQIGDNSQLRRVVIYVKSGIYKECVEIDANMRNVMVVGDGIDKTIVTGNRNVPDGYTTFSSATFGVSGDGFWARDITFENTAGPEKEQAVALRVAADHAAFYRCGFRGYQDTLFAHSLRQFYRECRISGTVDFIFGNAAAVLQNCDIYVRKPMLHQANMITAQGRDDPNQNTGFSIHASRVRPAPDFEGVKGSFKSYLGRPWKKYSRVVFMKTELDGLVNPEGWAKWEGDFALDSLYYGEYMNSGDGAFTGGRVKWVGFHVLKDSSDAAPFTVERFIEGRSWIPETGVPYWLGV